MTSARPLLALLFCGTSITAMAAAEVDSDAPTAVQTNTQTHVTDAGNTVEVVRNRHEGDAGGAAVQRRYTVTDPEGNEVRAGSDARWRSGEGDVGRQATRSRTNENGDTLTRRRAAGVTEDGSRWRRQAQTVTDADGIVQARRVGRTASDGEGRRVRTDRGRVRGESGAQSGRRMTRQRRSGQ